MNNPAILASVHGELSLASAHVTRTLNQEQKDEEVEAQEIADEADEMFLTKEFLEKGAEYYKDVLVLDGNQVFTDYVKEQLQEAQKECCRSLIWAQQGQIVCDLTKPKAAKSCNYSETCAAEEAYESGSDLPPVTPVFSVPETLGFAGMPGTPVLDCEGGMGTLLNMVKMEEAGFADAKGKIKEPVKEDTDINTQAGTFVPVGQPLGQQQPLAQTTFIPGAAIPVNPCLNNRSGFQFTAANFGKNKKKGFYGGFGGFGGLGGFRGMRRLLKKKGGFVSYGYFNDGCQGFAAPGFGGGAGFGGLGFGGFGGNPYSYYG